MTSISPTVQTNVIPKARVIRATQPQLQEDLLSSPAVTKSQEQSSPSKAINTVNYGSFVGRLYDAGFRGVMRYLEASKFGGTLIRIPFRAVAELLRHGTGASLDLIVNKQKVTKAVLLPTVRRALENTVATTIIDPNNIGSGKVMRMIAGFANMVCRLAARVLLTALDVVDPGDLDMESLSDELVGRTLPRVICTDTMNPIIGIATRTIEQLGINELTKLGPIQKFKAAINNRSAKTTQAV